MTEITHISRFFFINFLLDIHYVALLAFFLFFLVFSHFEFINYRNTIVSLFICFVIDRKSS